MRRRLGIASGVATAAVLAALAGGAASSDIYITGKVMGRVAGSPLSSVQVAWNYKCLGGKLGDATYEWTLKLVRLQPLPERTTTLGAGTSQRGTKTVRLAPGQYLPKADPFFCETERGAGYDKPEVGAPFVVPDYCSWKITASFGAVELEQASAVKLARQGATMAPGDALTTPGGGRATLSSLAGEGKVVIGSASRLRLDAARCPRSGGWRFSVTKGTVTVTVPATVKGKAAFETAAPRAVVAGVAGSGWRVDVAGKKTRVRALVGKVTVKVLGGPSRTLRAGQSATI